MIDELRRLRKQVDTELRNVTMCRDAITGNVEPATYHRYLATIASQYAPHSPIVMSLAAARLLKDHTQLGLYLLRHAVDEQGHDRWASDDLSEDPQSKRMIGTVAAVPACSAMIGYTYYLATYGNPLALFGWMYILEAVGADLGPDVAAGLQKQQLPDRFVAGHAQADRDHIIEIETMIQKYISAAQSEDVVHAAKVSADLYVRMFEEADRGS